MRNTGFYYYGARYYNPRESLWLSVDPLAEKTMDAYGYCNQNPVNLVDPTGMAPNPTPYYKTGLGSVNYYIFRYLDFIKRNPGREVPEYYMNYGNKYVHRFTYELYGKLSSTGKEWLVKSRRNLQVAIENRLNPNKYSDANTIELDNDRFQEFAFESHVKAYWDAGLSQVSSLDLIQIGLTPDASDLFTLNGIEQATKIGLKLAEYWKANPLALQKRIAEAKRDKAKISQAIQNKATKEGVPVSAVKKLIEVSFPQLYDAVYDGIHDTKTERKGGAGTGLPQYREIKKK